MRLFILLCCCLLLSQCEKKPKLGANKPISIIEPPPSDNSAPVTCGQNPSWNRGKKCVPPVIPSKKKSDKLKVPELTLEKPDFTKLEFDNCPYGCIKRKKCNTTPCPNPSPTATVTVTPSPTPGPTVTVTVTPTVPPEPGACSETDPIWTTCSAYDGTKIAGYRIYNNLWGTGNGNCMWAQTSACWGAAPTYVNGYGDVKAYLEAWRGYHYNMMSGESDGNGLPAQMDTITKVIGTWAMETPNAGRYMALWDIYFQLTDGVRNEQGDANLMLFQYIYDRTGWLASDQDVTPPAPFVTVGGYSWRYKYIPSEGRVNNGPVLVMYMFPQNSQQEWGSETATIDIKAIYDWAVTEELFPASMFLRGVQVGWETIEVGPTFGDGKFKTKNFVVQINNE